MIVPWTIGALLRELASRGEHPAVMSFGDDRVETRGSKTVAENAQSLACRLRENGVDNGTAVALWAPNSPAWIAVSVYVLVAIVKKRLSLDASLYTLLQILSVTLFEKIPMDQALTGDDAKDDTSQITNQLNLFAY